MKYDFSDKTIVVIGASSGIGLCTAIRFAENGGRVFFVSRSGAKEEIEKLEKKGLKVESVSLDVTRPKAVKGLISHIIVRHKKIDILVNAQAINQCLPIEKISLADWEKMMATNLTSIFLACKACISHMKNRRYGKIINISSIAARNRSPVSGVHYVASKTAILGFTRQLAFEVAPFNINVNSVCPGQTITPMLMSSMSRKQVNSLAKCIPLKRLAQPVDQANVIMFLASDEASYLSGATIDVNGGQI